MKPGLWATEVPELIFIIIFLIAFLSLRFLSAFMVIISVLSWVLVIKCSAMSISVLSTKFIHFVFVLFWLSTYLLKFLFLFYFLFYSLLSFVIEFLLSLHSSRALKICVSFLKMKYNSHIWSAYNFNLSWQIYTSEWRPFLLSRCCLFVLFQKIPRAPSQSFTLGKNSSGFSLSVLFLRFIHIYRQ